MYLAVDGSTVYAVDSSTVYAAALPTYSLTGAAAAGGDTVDRTVPSCNHSLDAEKRNNSNGTGFDTDRSI